MAEEITISECITRLDAIRHEIVPNSKDHFALSAGIAALYEMEKDAPAVNRWIPCSERMPDKNESVLCFCRAEITEVLYWNGSSWHSTDANKGYLSGFVTHWMPLPEPPREE